VAGGGDALVGVLAVEVDHVGREPEPEDLERLVEPPLGF
jgi:hypothetical protein